MAIFTKVGPLFDAVTSEVTAAALKGVAAGAPSEPNPKSARSLLMAAMSVAVIFPGAAARLGSAVCSVVKAALIAVVAEASVKVSAMSWLYKTFGRAWKLVAPTPPVPLPPPAAPERGEQP